MRKKYAFLFFMIIITVILLSSCSKAAAATVSASNGLSSITRLGLGTLKLEGTGQAVTASQAGQLLTLWQAYQSLSNSDTSSQVELEALVKQIQGVMTSDQLKAIEAMDLNDQSVNEVLQSLGGSNSASASAPASTPNTTTLSQAGPGGAPGGMLPDGGGVSMGDITGEIMAQSTPDASQFAASSESPQLDGRLLNALLQLLEMRSQASG